MSNNFLSANLSKNGIMLDIDSSSLLYIISGIIILIILFLLLREVVCWYYKINERIAMQDETNELLKKLISKYEGEAHLNITSGSPKSKNENTDDSDI